MIHLTGTNGKTSTSRMIDTLLRALDLRTGRFTSPHVERMSERISVDGEPLSDEEFVAAFNDVAPYIALVDAEEAHPLSFFETIVAMAYARFAEAPVDVAVVEVGMGGSWDATNVADGAVAVVLPIAVDHARVPRQLARGDRDREGRDHQAGCRGGAGRAAARRGRGAARAGDRGRGERPARGPGLRRGVAGAGGGRPGGVAAGAARAVRRAVPAAVRRAPGPERRRRAGRRGGLRRGQRAAGRRARAGGVRPGDLAGPARDRAHRSDDRAGRRAQPARRRGGRGGARGLVHARPADRRDRRDGRQGRRGAAGGVRAAPRPRRLHPELHRRARCPPAELAVVAAEVFGEDRVTVEPRLADAIDEAAGAGRGRSRAPRSVPAACWSPVRSSRSARPGPCCAGDGREHAAARAVPASRHVRRGALAWRRSPSA